MFSRPDDGTHSGVSSSACLISGDVMTWMEGTSRAIDPISPEALGSISAVMPTLKWEKACTAVFINFGLPYTHHRIGATSVVMRRCGPQYFVRTAEVAPMRW